MRRGGYWTMCRLYASQACLYAQQSVDCSLSGSVYSTAFRRDATADELSDRDLEFVDRVERSELGRLSCYMRSGQIARCSRSRTCVCVCARACVLARRG